MAIWDSHDSDSTNQSGNNSGGSVIDVQTSGEISTVVWIGFFSLMGFAAYKIARACKRRQEIKLSNRYPRGFRSYKRDRAQTKYWIDDYFYNQEAKQQRKRYDSERDVEWGRLHEVSDKYESQEESNDIYRSPERKRPALPAPAIENQSEYTGPARKKLCRSRPSPYTRRLSSGLDPARQQQIREEAWRWIEKEKIATPMGQNHSPSTFVSESGRVLADWSKSKRDFCNQTESAPGCQDHQVIQYMDDIVRYSAPPPSVASKPPVTMPDEQEDSYDNWVNKGQHERPDIAGQGYFEDTGIEPWYN